MFAVKYIFWKGSVAGLDENIEVIAHNYIQAEHKVLKYIAMGKVKQHPVCKRIASEVTEGSLWRA